MHARAPQEETGEGVEAVLRRLEARFGEGVVTLARAHAPIAVIPTGSPALDTALGIGGLPRGRIVEIYGPEASGKTSLALGIIAEAQRGGGTCAFIDAEHALDDGYAARLGVDPNRLLLSRPDTGEQALEITEQLICCGGVAVVVVDSVAALTPRAERQAGIGQAPPGLQARLMSQGLRRLAAPAARAGCTVIFINQMRRALGAWQGFSQTTPGGYALRFYASVRLELSVAAPLRRGGG
ncbi:MAG: hypothetical protein EOM91_17535, partial [Sphingobacteriia bacterium]|nr:hypothetical protein [Sphingobacteriia bacterium]